MSPLPGLMQHDHPLTIAGLVRRMATVTARSEVVDFRADGRTTRRSFAGVADRAARLGAHLGALGVREGDRVATLAWNSAQHLEAYLGIPAIGAVLHTVNLRLTPEHLTYVLNHGGARVLLVDRTLLGLLEAVADDLTELEHLVLLGEGPEPGAALERFRSEDLDAALADVAPLAAWPEVDDRAAAALCYTSGTTGNPKGVLYSHRSSVLHALAAGMVDTLAVGRGDRVLPIVPMFHANAWGLPYACALTGASLVFVGRDMSAATIAAAIAAERVTIAAGVPTIWMDLLRYAEQHEVDVSSLRCAPCGGAAVPRALMEGFERRLGAEIVQAWGMTETSPLGAVARVPEDVPEEERWARRLAQGTIAPLVEARLVDDAGVEQPWDGTSEGELQVRGPWIAAGYYRDPDASEEAIDDGWLRTGDVATIDDRGTLRLTDRAKDIIKSGGEWISSVALEGELLAHPEVLEAAVIAHPDERWTERPLACVVLAPRATAGPAELRAFLAERVARWWVPERFAFIEEVPKTSVGKFDKKVLRARLAEGALAVCVDGTGVAASASTGR
ncbi:long-chain fatty acid--CoA ligase [Patulibacter brassicae]|uniref:Long-chain fatty acid--CoA ligase n=1 Tax=Patulibacter brassicae TaxID=1705717 RepID=A0ABU4VQB1_9ACTN|nr:long-chain fatty acid--CoA ligase [Patulibacter brassicae]MDX8153274.1 long-chain fatty acid--CoA ligase [Patulibacter brassicae]